MGRRAAETYGGGNSDGKLVAVQRFDVDVQVHTIGWRALGLVHGGRRRRVVVTGHHHSKSATQGRKEAT